MSPSGRSQMRKARVVCDAVSVRYPEGLILRRQQISGGVGVGSGPLCRAMRGVFGG